MMFVLPNSPKFSFARILHYSYSMLLAASSVKYQEYDITTQHVSTMERLHTNSFSYIPISINPQTFNIQ